MTAEVRTWGEALNYTLHTRWKGTPAEITNSINSGHITEYAGKSMPLSRMGKAAWWIQLTTDLLEDHPQWSTSTVNRVVSAGTTVLKTCQRAGLTEVSCPTFDRLKEGEMRVSWFTKEQVEKLAFAARDVFDRPDLSDAILVSAYTGIRQGELLKLLVEDVDSETNTLWVGGRRGRETKGKEVRAIPIADRIKDILEQRVAGKPPTAKLFGGDWSSKDQLYTQFKRVRKYIGLSEDYVWHSLRHSLATWLGEVAHPRQIQAIMGHKSIETTLRYCKASDPANRRAMAQL